METREDMNRHDLTIAAMIVTHYQANITMQAVTWRNAHAATNNF
jgi:hypothetical protein